MTDGIESLIGRTVTEGEQRDEPGLLAVYRWSTAQARYMALDPDELAAVALKHTNTIDPAAVRPSTVQVEAAKLRLVTDRRLGKESPAWLQRVAKGLPARGVKAAG